MLHINCSANETERQKHDCVVAIWPEAPCCSALVTFAWLPVSFEAQTILIICKAWLTHRLDRHLEHHADRHLEHHADRQGVILKQWQGSWSKGKPGMTHKRRNIIKSTTFVLWDFQTKSTTWSMSMRRKRTRCIFCGHANRLGTTFSWWNKRSVRVAQQPPHRVGCPKHIASKGNDPKVFGDLPDRPSWEGSTPSPTLQAWCSKVDLQSYQIVTWN